MKRKNIFARLIIVKKWNGNIEECKSVIENVLLKWPSNTKVAYLVSCGGFIIFPWPKRITKNIVNNKKIELISNEAEKYIRLIMTPRMLRKISKVADYVSFGIDSHNNRYPYEEVELVALYEISTNKIFWTGKSYPTVEQQKRLLKIANIGSHLIKTKYGNTLIMGCHDLNVFNPRVKARAKKWRKDILNNIDKLMKRKRPTTVIQHPHTTDSLHIWKSALSGLFKYPFVKYFCSAGRYYNNGTKCRSKLEKVLSKTIKGKTIDFIIS